MKELHRLKKGRDVLVTLKEYGVLNYRILKLLTPTIRYDRNRRKILDTLLKKRLIVKRIQRFESENSYMNFYQLNQRLEAREALSKYLNCTADDVRQLQWRFLTPLLEQFSIEVAFQMKQIFPNANIIHDYNFALNDSTKKVFLDHANEILVIPDLLILLPDLTQGQTLNIAIETNKHDHRRIQLTDKLEYYLTKTNIDVVMFVGTLDRTEEHIISICANRKLQKLLNISNKKDFFFVAHTNSKNFKAGLDLLIDLKGQKQNLHTWLAKIEQSFTHQQQSINSSQARHTCALGENSNDLL